MSLTQTIFTGKGEIEMIWFLPLAMEEMTMNKLIIWRRLLESKDLDLLLVFLVLVSAPCKNNKVEKPAVNHLEDREEMKLAQLESYLSADDNQGIVDLSLYL